jgi:hypothetical protein
VCLNTPYLGSLEAKLAKKLLPINPLTISHYLLKILGLALAYSYRTGPLGL